MLTNTLFIHLFIYFHKFVLFDSIFKIDKSKKLLLPKCFKILSAFPTFHLVLHIKIRWWLRHKYFQSTSSVFYLSNLVLQPFVWRHTYFSLQASKSIIPFTQLCFAIFFYDVIRIFFAGIEINHPIYATLFCNLLVSFSVTNVIIGLLPILSFKWWTR